ncbi:hypothetical protein [Nocardioides ginkgobilobae]
MTATFVPRSSRPPEPASAPRSTTPTRGFGGTLGVAVVVSLSSSLYADRLLERLGAGDEQ